MNVERIEAFTSVQLVEMTIKFNEINTVIKWLIKR